MRTFRKLNHKVLLTLEWITNGFGVFLLDFHSNEFKFFICHVHSHYNEAVIGNKTLSSQAPSNNMLTRCV